MNKYTKPALICRVFESENIITGSYTAPTNSVDAVKQNMFKQNKSINANNVTVIEMGN